MNSAWSVCTGKQLRTFDLAGLGLFVQPLGVALLALLQACVDEHLDKGERWVVLGMELACIVSIGLVRRDKRGDTDGGRRREQQGHLGNAADVLLTILGGETQVLVESEADVVTIHTECRLVQMQQVLLESRSNGGLAGRREAREPDAHSLLVQQLRTLRIRHSAGVESDVRGHGELQ